VGAYFPGATVIKTALDGTDWTIRKNELGLPRYRTRDVLVPGRIPGQKRPWLILGPYEQDYAGAAPTQFGRHVQPVPH
jgi:hypothetical protein